MGILTKEVKIDIGILIDDTEIGIGDFGLSSLNCITRYRVGILTQ